MAKNTKASINTGFIVSSCISGISQYWDDCKGIVLEVARNNSINASEMIGKHIIHLRSSIDCFSHSYESIGRANVK